MLMAHSGPSPLPLPRLVVALFGPDALDRRCPLLGEEPKFAARCQSDAIDPEQKSAVAGFRGNRIQVIAGRPWRSTTDKRRLARVIAVHHLERGTASFGRRRQAHEHQIIKVPFGRSPRKRQHRGNGGQTGEFSKTRLLIAHRICAARQQVCTAIRSTIVLSLAALPLADHFSPSPMVG